MKLQNREGTSVDPVPFLVVAGIAFATCYSYGPMYFMELGCTLRESLGASTAAFLGATVASYHRLVWTARPELRREVPAEHRLRRLVLLAVIGLAVIVLLALPLVARA